MKQTENFLELLSEVEAITGEKITAVNYMNDSISNVVTILGQPQDNLLKLILNEKDTFGKLSMPVIRGYRCAVKYSEESKLLLVNDEQHVETTEDSIIELLSSFSPATKPVKFVLMLPNKELKDLTIEIIASDADFEDIDTDEIIAGSDYCYMTLSATAILSMCQRRLLRKTLLPKMEKSLGALIQNSELLQETGKQEVANSIETFFKNTVPVYDTAEKEFSFYSIVSLLSDRWDELHSNRKVRAKKICIEQALEKVKKSEENFSSNADYAEDALALLNEKARALPSRQDAASRRCRMKFISPMQVECSGEISNFYQMISDKIHEEIQKCDDVEKVQKLIPGYIENEWNREKKQISSSFHQIGDNLEKELISYIEKDIIDFLGAGGNNEIIDYIIHIMHRPHLGSPVDINNVHVLEEVNMAKDYTALKKGGTISAGIGMVFLGHPLIGVGLAIYGLTKAGKGESLQVLEKNKQSLIVAADKLNSSYYDEATTQLDDSFKEINENLNYIVKESYNKIMDAMVTTIQDRKADVKVKESSLAELQTLEMKLSEIL